jgi:nicotinate-nucleotide pyrophosphorylase (carboxylating)
VKAVPFEPLDPAWYREIVRRAVAEDLGWGDLTTDAIVPSDRRARGVLIARSPLVLAGLAVAIEAFLQLDPAATIIEHRHDGESCLTDDRIAEIRGFAAPMLTAERTALNFLQRLSGIATLTRQFVDAARGRIRILDTRKTTPLLRVLEKYAVRAGGGINHRMALDEGLLIKDNHIRLAGGIAPALERLQAAEHEMPIEVEAQSLEQVDEALAAGASLILVDNLSTDEVREAVRRTRGRAQVEISGGVTFERLEELASTGAEFVSIGALTHSAPAADISFEIESDDSQQDGP